MIKGTGAVVRRFDHKRNTATQVRPKPLCKQTIAGGTRKISQYINHMQERNDYDYIVIHSGTNDVGKLTANEIIRTYLEICLVNLKHRWPISTLAISGLTYVEESCT